MERNTRGGAGADHVLQRAVETLEGVGATRARAFAGLGVKTLGDLLEYFPRDYQYEAAERAISQLQAGQIQFARGEVVAVDYVAGRTRGRFEATLDDGSEKLSLAWFNAAWLRGKIVPGMHLRVQGMVKTYHNIPQMVQAKWEPVDADTARIEKSTFRAVYPATARLNSEMIGKIIEENLETMVGGVEELFSPSLLKRHELLPRAEAYRLIHRPADLKEAVRARRRLVYDELMLMQLGLGLGKRLRQGRISAPVLRIDKTLDQRIRRRFPFELTSAQQNAIWQIVRDLQSGRPMNRLLQGDVGSGKTVVALYAMLVAIANRMQAAILAPTEVLAEQHYLTLGNLLRDSAVKVGLYTHRTQRAGKTARAARKALAEGQVHLAIGTQALLQEGVEFANLGLVVVDEQHKLGVEQRAVLKGKGLAAHYLVMTATPIPRTLALSYFADFDLTTIDQLPPGRQPIVTRRLRGTQAGQAYEFIREQVAGGRQAYIVLPKIDDEGLDDSASVKREYERLAKGALAGLRLGMLHGQMKTEEKQAVMGGFREGQIDVLVATTVIEVGIDVPNATVMLIGEADRFGLSQLHQLRGRVGRGSELSHCLLLSDAMGEMAESRLGAMTRTSDGFEIAEMDLRLRGPGEFFGTRQHGLPEFKLADVTAEMDLLRQAKEDAGEILIDDPGLARGEHRALREALGRQFGGTLGLAQVG